MCFVVMSLSYVDAVVYFYIPLTGHMDTVVIDHSDLVRHLIAFFLQQIRK